MATTEQKMLSAELNTLNLNKPDMSGQAGSNNSQNNSTNNSHKSNSLSTSSSSNELSSTQNTTSEEEDIIVDVEDEIDILDHYQNESKNQIKRFSHDDGIHSRGSRSTSKCSSEVSCTSDSNAEDNSEMKKSDNLVKSDEKPTSASLLTAAIAAQTAAKSPVIDTEKHPKPGGQQQIKKEFQQEFQQHLTQNQQIAQNQQLVQHQLAQNQQIAQNQQNFQISQHIAAQTQLQLQKAGQGLPSQSGHPVQTAIHAQTLQNQAIQQQQALQNQLLSPKQGCCAPSAQVSPCGPSACGPSACGPSSCGPSSCGPAPCGPSPCGPTSASACGPNQPHQQHSNPMNLPILGSEPRENPVNPSNITNPENMSENPNDAEKKDDVYKCRFCDRTFCYLCHLKVHERVHTGEKPYKCSFCDVTFSQLGSLTVHMRIHTGEKPYECRICKKKFRHINSLRRHQRQVHRKQPGDEDTEVISARPQTSSCHSVKNSEFGEIGNFKTTASQSFLNSKPNPTNPTFTQNPHIFNPFPVFDAHLGQYSHAAAQMQAAMRFEAGTPALSTATGIQNPQQNSVYLAQHQMQQQQMQQQQIQQQQLVQAQQAALLRQRQIQQLQLTKQLYAQNAQTLAQNVSQNISFGQNRNLSQNLSQNISQNLNLTQNLSQNLSQIGQNTFQNAAQNLAQNMVQQAANLQQAAQQAQLAQSQHNVAAAAAAAAAIGGRSLSSDHASKMSKSSNTLAQQLGTNLTRRISLESANEIQKRQQLANASALLQLQQAALTGQSSSQILKRAVQNGGGSNLVQASEAKIQKLELPKIDSQSAQIAQKALIQAQQAQQAQNSQKMEASKLVGNKSQLTDFVQMIERGEKPNMTDLSNQERKQMKLKLAKYVMNVLSEDDDEASKLRRDFEKRTNSNESMDSAICINNSADNDEHVDVI